MYEHGFGGFIKALRRDHDFTSTEFYDHLGIGPEEEPGYWPIDHEPTRTVLESYIEELRSRQGHPETTVRPIRFRLKKYVWLYADVNETENLLDPLRGQDGSARRDRPALAVFDLLNEVPSTPASKFKYLEDMCRFSGYLIDAGRAVYNPLNRMATRFGWDRPDWVSAEPSSGRRWTQLDGPRR